MSADQVQGALPLPWFFGLLGAVLAVSACCLLVEGWQVMRRADDALDVYGGDDGPELVPLRVWHPSLAQWHANCDCPACARAVVIARQMLAARARQMLADRVHIDMDSPEVEAELAELLRGGLR